jgi:hypothetical protein
MPKLSSRLSEGRQQDVREVERQAESRFDKLTGWTIVRNVTLGIVLAAALNVLMGYLVGLTG